MNEYQVRVYFASGRMSYNIGTLIKGDYNSSKLVFDFDDDTGIKMFELLKPDGETKWVKEIVNNEIILADTDELGEVIPLLTQEGTYIFEVAKYDGNSKLTSVKGKFKVKDEQVSTSDIPLEEVSKVELDDLINDVAKVVEEGTEATANTIEQANYAKQQGDYAKEQAHIIIDANTTATKIINDFETNVNEYTKDFNTNAEEKLEVYNQNDIDKTKAYNKNAESKENSYNENAADKLKEYNDNATTKLSEYNINSETKTKVFNTNASEKTDAFNLNVTNKTTDFNSNAEAKTTEFNDNATTKTEEYNTNAEAKVNEFNTNVDELRKDVEDCYNNMLTAEVEGTSIHVEDSANARVLVLENEGNLKQETTEGKQLFDKSTTIDGQYFDDSGNIVYESESFISDYIEVEKDEYILSIDNSNSALRICTYDENKNFVRRIISTSQNNLAIEISETEKYVILSSNNLANKDTMQFELGTTSTKCEKYTGGQPSPNPDYPQEVEVIEAYNLFDKDNANVLNAFIDSGNGNINTTTSGKSIYLEIPNNTKNITVSRIGGQRFCVGTIDALPSVGSTCLNCMGNNTSSSITIPVLPESKYLVVYYYNSLYDTLTEQEILDNIQIVKGSEVKPYTPYGCIRNKFIGKNFFDISIWKNITLHNKGGIIVTTDNSITIENSTGADLYTASGMESKGSLVYSDRRKYLIEVEPNTEYTISFDVDGTINNTASNNSSYFSCIDKDFKSVSQGSFGSFVVPTNKQSKTITTTADTKYLGIRFGTDRYEGITRIYSNIQIEKSPVPTKFEPYQENTVDINLQGNFMAKIGDVKDALRIENGRAILTKRIGEKTFDGTEVWNAYNNETINTTRGFLTAISDIQKSTYGIQNVICNKFKFDNTWGTDIEACNNQGTSFVVRVKLDRLTDNSITGFKAYLTEQYANGTPLKAKYILAEPYEVDLGEVKMPKTYEGTTNVCLISNLESNMKLKYVRSTNIVVDNLAKAIVALGGEV